ncbi:hypothetical protein [Lactobacillus pasteurii]|uniref:Uncharacterized protein n=1 Tax=Lactobacillus pasteurii DSM 23907 = CRBIP 24.76 TaxID=1423790 RepID=I7LDP2_9LACO|nr:hypothetical protein [Lactobacillus pasteurii]TDG78166.1 hypothetical protein C5L33_000229 [Lactobacillus pasteurii]CCI85093.1 Putative uncharacterized protein [Lactobacillus pasteurii DSM 23907 = CRBIP 24.76]
MTESVFFNPGDAIASSHDYKAARRSAQIFKANKPTAGQIIIAKNAKNGEYAIYLADRIAPSNQGVRHDIKDRL